MLEKFSSLALNIAETRHALRVNEKITVAKRHLTKAFPGCPVEKAFFRFLVTVPFLHDRGDKLGLTSDHQLYCIAKAKRLYDAFGLDSEKVPVFMLACLVKAGDLDMEQAAKMGNFTVVNADDPNWRDNVPEEDRQDIEQIVSALEQRQAKPTLH